MYKWMSRPTLFTLLVVLSILKLVSGETCEFPQSWRATSWLVKYSQSGSTFKPIVRKFGFNTTQMTEEGTTNVVDRETCLSSSVVDPYFFMIRMTDGQTNPFCVNTYKTSNFMTQQVSTVAVEPDKTAAQCSSGQQNYGNVHAEVSVRYPVNWKASCMLPEGSYHILIRKSATSKECEGNVRSEAIVKSDSIIFKSCSTATPTYLHPYNSELTCHGDIHPAILESDKKDERYLLLSFKDPTTNLPFFYCVKWIRNDTTKGLHLSFDMNSQTELKCDATSNYDTVSTGTKIFHAISLKSNYCMKKPCQNGAKCREDFGNYTCTCTPGYTGTNCETNINECTSTPCQHGGPCTDQVNGYTCRCTAGYSGSNCETDINECASTPCQHGGNCTDTVNGYTCKCPAGYNDPNCETTQIWQIVGGVAGSVVLLIVCVVVAIFVWRRKRREKVGDQEERKTTEGMSDAVNGGDYEVSTKGGDYEVPTNGGDYEVPTIGGDYEVPTNGGDYEVPTEEDQKYVEIISNDTVDNNTKQSSGANTEYETLKMDEIQEKQYENVMDKTPESPMYQGLSV